MTPIQPVAILIPLAVGAIAFLCTIFIHALPLGAIVNLVRHETKVGRVGGGFWTDLPIVVLIISLALLAHLAEVGLWAVVFMMCGEFHELGTAYYHSAVNYTTLGYGDVVMSPSWRLLGPLEAANGGLMFGVSTAMIFTVTQRLIQARYTDLKN